MSAPRAGRDSSIPCSVLDDLTSAMYLIFGRGVDPYRVMGALVADQVVRNQRALRKAARPQ